MKFMEGLTVELKKQITDDIQKTVIAFTNTDGGTVYIGIDDNGDITGVQNIDGEMLRVSNMIRDAIKPDVTLFTSYEVEELEGKNVIKVIVQKGTKRPYYLASKGLRPEGVYVRQGASTAPASDSTIIRMIKETDGDSYENMRSINQDLTFETASIEFNIRKVPFSIGQYRTLKLINEDGIYTNLAHILSDQCVHTIKAAVFEGTDKAVFKDRQEFSGSLLLQLKDAYDYISRYNRIRAEFSGLHRIDKKDYPEEALRESLLNSLAHRDYSYSASTLISIFDDRIEFLSVGGLVKGISLNDIMLGVSVSRNENLANIFYRLTLIEAYGTGIPKIFRSYKDFPIQPKIEVSDNAFKITLPNKNETDEKIFLSENEKVVMELLNEKYEITRKDVQETLNSSQTMAGRVVKKLTDRGLIKQIGKGKNTRYLR
ncbi:RNA-binding domain-containing protein [Sedimentibacter sp.]|uniref:RNA-binding domain-containing protein n=1 Tax=Sedimentibacter sp. TaxID=1960295 RepID=UPI00289F4DFE|nr:RNA-binding domain-containing protein [Sedimentibacter sp.]